MTRSRALLLMLAPAAPFLLIALAAAVGWMPDPYLYLHGDVVIVAVTFAALLTGHVGFLLWRGWAGRRRVRRAITQTRDTAIEERGRFVRRLHHEIKHPLGALRDELADLQETALDPTQQQHVATVEALVQRVTDLVAELRRLTDLRVRPLQRELVDVKDLVMMVVDHVHDEDSAHPYVASGGEIQFECVGPWDLPAVSGDPELLSIALYNLVGNACKFTPPQGRVQVVVDQEDRWVTVEVVDTGRGILPQDLERVGQELFRGQNVGDLPGRGMGLATARAIVEVHGGSLDVQSAAGQGTVVKVRLPAGREEAK